MDVHSSSLLLVAYALFSDVSLRQLEGFNDRLKFPDPFAQAILFVQSFG